MGDDDQVPEWQLVETIVVEDASHRADIETRASDGLFRFAALRGVWTRSDHRAWTPTHFSGLYDTRNHALRDARQYLAALAARQPNSDELESSVKKVLWRDWDPIGVNDIPEAYGEYDSYAQAVVGLLRRGASEQELRDHLAAISEEAMGIGDAAAAGAAAALLARLSHGGT